DAANFTGLVQEFRNQLNSAGSGLLLTAAVTAGSDKIGGYQPASLTSNLDFIDIMTYDFFGAWSNQIGYGNSPLHAGNCGLTGAVSTYDTADAVNMWVNGGASRS